MTERKHLFRIGSLNSRKKRIPVVSCLNFFSTALLFRTIEISNALPLPLVKIFSDSLTKLDWGSSFTFAKPCKSRIPKRIDDARSRFSILIFAKFPFLCAQEETQFFVCNFQEIYKEYLMFGKFLNSRLTRKFLLNPGLGLFLWKIQVLTRDIRGVFHFVSFANI